MATRQAVDMANRRMFARTITESDAFTDLPLSAQALWFHMGMSADDDGIVNNPKRVQRCIGATDDDARLLLAKGFIIAFDSGVVAIRDWRVNNCIRSDRYKPTIYQAELASLNNGSCLPGGIPNVIPNDIPAVDQGKERPHEDSSGKSESSATHAQRPTLEEVAAYCKERGNSIDPERFIDYYTANGWYVGKRPMRDWKAAVRSWEKHERQQGDTQNEFSAYNV